MSGFERSFPLADLARWEEQHPGNVVRALFSRWAYPGEKATSTAPLRLCVRKGYVNFYLKGQSVAKLSCSRHGPKLQVHEAYVSGRKRGDSRVGVTDTQKYQSFHAQAIADPAKAALIDGWIETAASYASVEKHFVDDLVASNPGVIDLEMGLPESLSSKGKRAAPRMDIVSVQLSDGIPSLAFWEAKCANNQELRSSKKIEDIDGEFSGSKVFWQLRKYIDWVKQGDRLQQVAEAYRNTADILLEFDRLFGSENKSVRDCTAIWKILAEAKEPRLIPQPGLVVGNYWPEGCHAHGSSGLMPQAASFAENEHRKKLQDHGVIVFETDAAGALLPNLPTAQVAA